MYIYISATAESDQASKSLAGRRRTSVDGSNRQLEGGPFVVAVPRKTRAAPPVTSVSQRRYLPRSFTYVSSHCAAAGAGGARAHTRLSHRPTAPSVAPRAEERGGWEELEGLIASPPASGSPFNCRGPRPPCPHHPTRIQCPHAGPLAPPRRGSAGAPLGSTGWADPTYIPG